MSYTLTDRVVVVTGAGRGMGAGIATALVEAGARVVCVDVAPGTAEATAATLGGAAHAVGLTGDIGDDAVIGATIAAALDRFGRLDGWVNNAGVITMAPAIDQTPAEVDEHLRVNTVAVLRCCQAAARHWRDASRPGAIVNIASYAGKVGYNHMIAYDLSKAAVINLTRNLAREWAPIGVNVNCLCPSGVDTPMLDLVAEYWAGPGGDPAPIRADMNAGQLGRCIAPVEIGRVVAFLLSDAGQVIRGQAISVDGGDSPY